MSDIFIPYSAYKFIFFLSSHAQGNFKISHGRLHLSPQPAEFRRSPASTENPGFFYLVSCLFLLQIRLIINNLLICEVILFVENTWPLLG